MEQAAAIWIAIGALLVFGSFFAYMILMFYFPEWVGITGKVAREAHESHEGKTTPSDTFDENLEKMHHSKDPDRKTD